MIQQFVHVLHAVLHRQHSMRDLHHISTMRTSLAQALAQNMRFNAA